MISKVTVLCVMVAATGAAPGNLGSYVPPPLPSSDIFVPASYDFLYGVADDPSANNFGHQESRDGDVTTGEYYVALPDGRVQYVRYTADPVNGFQADITYEGEVVHPVSHVHHNHALPSHTHGSPLFSHHGHGLEHGHGHGLEHGHGHFSPLPHFSHHGDHGNHY